MKKENGAITLYVSIVCLFILIIGIANYVVVINKQAAQIEQLKEIEKSYQTGTTLEDEYKSYLGGEIIPIYTEKQLSSIGSGKDIYIKENGRIYTFTMNATYVLMNNIELSGEKSNRNWIPIGTETTPFTGVFEGNGYEIYNLYNKNVTSNSQALFGYAENAIIENLCIASGEIKGINSCAGILGTGKNTQLINITNKVSVITDEDRAGGIVGQIIGNIEKCINNGEIYCKGYLVGGIVGWTSENSTICNSYNEGIITSEKYGSGGIAGRIDNVKIQNCYNKGKIMAEACAGGICGDNRGEINKCFNLGDVISTGGDDYNQSVVGGIAGQTVDESSINYCYNRGIVVGKNDLQSGITSYLENSYITNCYNTMQNLDYPLIERIVGNSKIVNSYYIGVVTSEQQRTEADMKTEDFLNLLGGSTIWKLDTFNRNNGFIILNWQ